MLTREISAACAGGLEALQDLQFDFEFLHQQDDHHAGQQDDGEAQEDHRRRLRDGERRVGQVQQDEGDDKEAGEPAQLLVDGRRPNQQPLEGKGERHRQHQQDEHRVDQVVERRAHMLVDPALEQESGIRARLVLLAARRLRRLGQQVLRLAVQRGDRAVLHAALPQQVQPLVVEPPEVGRRLPRLTAGGCQL